MALTPAPIERIRITRARNEELNKFHPPRPREPGDRRARYDAAWQMSREMRFQAAAVSSHSMILVTLVTGSARGDGSDGSGEGGGNWRKQIAREIVRINCLW